MSGGDSGWQYPFYYYYRHRYRASTHPTSHSPPLTSPLPLPPHPQSPGGHDVIAGLFDALASCPLGSTLLGFVGGATGLVENYATPITAEKLAAYRGNGGFELLSRSMEALERIKFADIMKVRG